MAIPASSRTPVKASLVNCDPLVGIEDLGLTVAAQGLLQAVHAEPRLQGVGHPPGEHPTRIPVHHRDQVGKSMLQVDGQVMSLLHTWFGRTISMPRSR